MAGMWDGRHLGWQACLLKLIYGPPLKRADRPRSGRGYLVWSASQKRASPKEAQFWPSGGRETLTYLSSGWRKHPPGKVSGIGLEAWILGGDIAHYPEKPFAQSPLCFQIATVIAIKMSSYCWCSKIGTGDWMLSIWPGSATISRISQ